MSTPNPHKLASKSKKKFPPAEGNPAPVDMMDDPHAHKWMSGDSEVRATRNPVDVAIKHRACGNPSDKYTAP